MPDQPFKAFRERADYLGVFAYHESPAGILVVANRRVIGGEERIVWDLPGGGVEAGETLAEALVREMREETALDVTVGELLFVAEGERLRGGRRTGLWRSFFFRVGCAGGEIRHDGEPEILGHRFEPLATLPPLLDAPYHRGFLRWLSSGGTVRHAFDVWAD